MQLGHSTTQHSNLTERPQILRLQVNKIICNELKDLNHTLYTAQRVIGQFPGEAQNGAHTSSRPSTVPPGFHLDREPRCTARTWFTRVSCISNTSCARSSAFPCLGRGSCSISWADAHPTDAPCRTSRRCGGFGACTGPGREASMPDTRP